MKTRQSYINSAFDKKNEDAFGKGAHVFVFTHANNTDDQIETTINIGRTTKIGSILAMYGDESVLKMPWWAQIFKFTSPFIYRGLQRSAGTLYGAFNGFPEGLSITNSISSPIYQTYFQNHISPYQQQTRMVEIKGAIFNYEFSKDADTLVMFTQRPRTTLTMYIYPAQIVTPAEPQPESTNS